MIKSMVKKLLKSQGLDLVISERNTDLNDYNRLKNLSFNQEQVKLHFGCGPRILKDWINIDLSYEPFEKYLSSYTNEFFPPEIRGTRSDLYCVDVTQSGLPLKDNSVDLIFHEDFIEHLSQKQQWVFLSECFRVMKSGAVHRINTPNLVSSMKTNSNFAKGKAGVYVDEWDKYHHISVLTQKSIEEMLTLIGYSKVTFCKRDECIDKRIPKEYRPGKDREVLDGNLFVDAIK